ncbi:MAG: tyrosine transporter [Synechococcaceae cyanobacterium SM2_3_1]|nr:tyrosine transporter [Synechococcaceae cyanobacterium SM2_3_1]
MRDHNRLRHQPGCVWEAAALVAGTTVGAGILALPAVTLPAGVIPSSACLILIWLYLVTAGLLMAEVQINTLFQLGRADLGLLPMIRRSLGPWGAGLAGAAYLLNTYGLLTAYLTRGGSLLLQALHLQIWESWPGAGAALFTLIFGGLLYVSREKWIERLNTLLVAGVVLAFGVLMAGTLMGLQPEQLLHQNWQAVGRALPVMVVALVFHSVVPVITTQLEGDRQQIRQAIVGGSALPLLMFLVWNAVILGSTDPEVWVDIARGVRFDPLEHLPQMQEWVALFSEFAIVTSFIGFVYGLQDFYSDTLQVYWNWCPERHVLFLLSLVPPLLIALINPHLFFVALDYAGSLGAAILFGLIPALIVWQQRLHAFTGRVPSLVPGGKGTLAAVVTISGLLISQRLLSLLHDIS